jgi:hypothetical protein
MRGAF